VHRSLGVTTFAQLRASRPQLRLATSVHDGINHVGLAAHAILDRAGVDVTGWGGRFLEDERPFESLEHVLPGRANAIIHEAVMLPHWRSSLPTSGSSPSRTRCWPRSIRTTVARRDRRRRILPRHRRIPDARLLGFPDDDVE
jgi:hypothetical protein